MRISQVEIKNFRKLRNTKIDFDEKTTILVGSNNSGKTSAIIALDYFLENPDFLKLRDISIDNLKLIDDLGANWEKSPNDKSVDPDQLNSVLPSMDVWIDVPKEQVHQVVKILPTLEWKGGLIGVRLQYQAKDLDALKHQYLVEREQYSKVDQTAQKSKIDVGDKLWPKTLSHFLERRLSSIELKSFPLDPALVGTLQSTSTATLPFDGHPLKEIVKVSQTGAQRGLSDSTPHKSGVEDETADHKGGRKLSSQLRKYYNQRIKPQDLPRVEDLEALSAILNAEKSFDRTLEQGFEKPFSELENLGYPGMSDPIIKIAAEIRVQDSLNHKSAVQYSMGNGKNHHLPEDYVGLGFQNLISITFDLMGYRDAWTKTHGNSSLAEENGQIEPIHLVLVEEPEAHLHAQVQQVFIRQAYQVLTNSDLLSDDKNRLSEGHNKWQTQLVISTHSSHIAYEADFSCLRYFKRKECTKAMSAQSSEVVSLSSLFQNSGDASENEEIRFVSKYLKATNCDLLFADAAIFIEGQAEKLLLPEFIKENFPNLHSRYYSIIEVSGSHAHKFKDLVELLGIFTLVVCDLDSVKVPEKEEDGEKKTPKAKSVAPKRNDQQTTSNTVLRNWHPKKESIDDLLDLVEKDHIGDSGKLYVSYQKEIEVNPREKQIPRTFEDALILSNSDSLKEIVGVGTTKKVRDLVDKNLQGEDLSNAIFELVQSAKKGDFALDCLIMQKGDKTKNLTPPDYIASGLKWLNKQLAPPTTAKKTGAK